jgi:signal transduction histidine kinase
MFYFWIFIFALQEQTISEEEIALIAYMTIVTITLLVIVIIFFVAFQKRKSKLLMDNFQQQKAFDEEISRSQTEIQEETLKHVGRELHDNVGQLLAYANMQLNALGAKVPEGMKPNVDETTQIVKDSLKEVRALSKSLNSDVLSNMGLEASLKNELDRLKRMDFSSTELIILGKKRELNDEKHGIIIFRILQEFFSNSVKYSEANEIKVSLDYQTEQLVIIASDDGNGFDVVSAEKGSGLINMRSRADLIATTFNLESQIGDGVKLTLNYPFE